MMVIRFVIITIITHVTITIVVFAIIILCRLFAFLLT